MRVTPRASVGLTAALLLAVALAHAATTDWPLDDPTAYEFDPSDVELASGAATLLPALGGTGADGDLTVTTTTFNLSSDTTASRAVADGVAWSVTDVLSAGATTLTLQAFAGGLAASDELLLMAVQGTPGAAGAAGTWELVGVSAVEVGGLVTVAPLANDYDGVGYAVVAQRVPHYADVTLTDATVTADGWDGVTGGVVAFRAAGTLTADAPSVITATGLGFRGGAGGSAAGAASEGGECFAGIDGDGGAVNADGTGGGGGGEGTANAVGMFGGDGGVCAGGGGSDGAVNSDDGAGSGGGGGHAGGGGGGGGGTGCGGTIGGAGGTGGGADVVAGGGGGSSCPGGDGGDAGSPGSIATHCYSTVAAAGEVGTAAIGGGGGDTCGAPYGGGGGGGGAFSGDADLVALHLGGGGGGGGGSSLGVTGGDGGSGGGAVLIFATEAQVDGTVSADATDGTAASTPHRGGGGGAGAGGSIYFAADEASIAALSAEGGSITANGTGLSGGGGGGDGRIRVDANEFNGVDVSDGGFDAAVQAVSIPAAGSTGGADLAYPTLAEVCASDFVAAGIPVLWEGFTTVEALDGGTITYTLSDDSLTYWWWDGGAWAVSAGVAESNSAADIDANLATIGLADLTWCAWLAGDGSQAVALEDVSIEWLPDTDGDGFEDDADCGPGDAAIFPGAPESCDLIDSDCDGDLVDGDPDFDTDGLPDCADNDDDADGDPDGSDCAPLDDTIFTGAPELCDAIDSDCDGSIGDEFPDFDSNGDPDCIDPPGDDDDSAGDDDDSAGDDDDSSSDDDDDSSSDDDDDSSSDDDDDSSSDDDDDDSSSDDDDSSSDDDDATDDDDDEVSDDDDDSTGSIIAGGGPDCGCDSGGDRGPASALLLLSVLLPGLRRRSVG